MTTSLKDVSSAQMIRSLAELGCFEHEFTAYGCIYLENGKVQYRLGGEWERVNDFVKGCRLKGMYPTPLAEKIVRQASLSGTEEEAKLKTKLELARQLQLTYNTTYTDIMARLQIIPPNDSAGEMLEQYREEIDGFFDGNEIQMFEEIVAEAYNAKLLTTAHLKELQAWLINVKMQMADDVLIKQNFSRTFYAFGQINQQGDIRHVINANEKSLMDQKLVAEKTGIVTTPVFKKTYWYARATDLNEVRQTFQETFKHLVNERYMGRLQMLRELPSAIDPLFFKEQLSLAREACSPQAVEVLTHYGRLWNVSN